MSEERTPFEIKRDVWRSLNGKYMKCYVVLKEGSLLSMLDEGQWVEGYLIVHNDYFVQVGDSYFAPNDAKFIQSMEPPVLELPADASPDSDPPIERYAP